MEGGRMRGGKLSGPGFGDIRKRENKRRRPQDRGRAIIVEEP